MQALNARSGGQGVRAATKGIEWYQPGHPEHLLQLVFAKQQDSDHGSAGTLPVDPFPGLLKTILSKDRPQAPRPDDSTNLIRLQSRLQTPVP